MRRGGGGWGETGGGASGEGDKGQVQYLDGCSGVLVKGMVR